MGDRVSVQFRTGEETSVVLFSHWGGMDLVKAATEHARILLDERTKTGPSRPLDRMEPGTVMVDFIASIAADRGPGRIKSDLYLGASPEDGDNGDNGHFVIDIDPVAGTAAARRSA